MSRALLLMVLLMAGTPVRSADPSTEKAALAGAWTAVAAEREGAMAMELIGHLLEIEDDRFRISAGDRLVYAGTHQIDYSTQPARIDFMHEEGEAADRVWEGVYRVDGDRLWICDNAADLTKPRPSDLATSPGSGHVLVTFER